jgi:lipopolysaccharide/colanic/teichoic acid biosynthesis glycosyltransferase
MRIEALKKCTKRIAKIMHKSGSIAEVIMNQEQISRVSMERMLAAQTCWGRAQLKLGVSMRQISWRLVIQSAHMMKRALDIAGSSIALVCLSPVLLVVSLIVKRDGGPVFFRQTRTGLNGKEFQMLKFRSMVVGAENMLEDLLGRNEKASGITFKMKDDPRVTGIGRLLRRSSLDELPQFWNVLKGDMSLVGPRPPVPREVALYTQADRRRLMVKPGITCFWQVGERHGGTFEVGDRNQIDFPEQVSLDVRYIESQSLGRDIWILAKTVPAILFGKGY